MVLTGSMLLFADTNLTFSMPGDNSSLYGHNVTRAESVLNDGARKSFVDYNFQLPDTFYIYAIPARTADTFLRLQIWRPVDLTSFRWQLVWQQRVHVTSTTDDGLYTVSISQQCELYAVICI